MFNTILSKSHLKLGIYSDDFNYKGSFATGLTYVRDLCFEVYKI